MKDLKFQKRDESEGQSGRGNEIDGFGDEKVARNGTIEGRAEEVGRRVGVLEANRGRFA